jgi:hypothetical protein
LPVESAVVVDTFEKDVEPAGSAWSSTEAPAAFFPVACPLIIVAEPTTIGFADAAIVTPLVEGPGLPNAGATSAMVELNKTIISHLMRLLLIALPG